MPMAEVVLGFDTNGPHGRTFSSEMRVKELGRVSLVLRAKTVKNQPNRVLSRFFSACGGRSLRRCAPRYLLKNTSILCTFWEPDPARTLTADLAGPTRLGGPRAQGGGYAAPAAALAANPAAAATTEATTEATSVSLDAAEQEHVVAAQAHVQAEAVAAVASVQVQVARAALSVAQQEQEDGHNNIARLEAQLSNVQIQMDESDAQLAAEKAAIRERVAEWERMQAAVVGELNELTPALAACMSVPACTLAVAYMSRRQKELVAHLQWIQSEAGQMAWMGL